MHSLGQNEIHLWYQDLESPHLQSLTKAQIGLLNSEETKRFEAFKVPWKQKEYWATRVLTRTVLSQYLSTSFESLKFIENSFGRPELFSTLENAPLQFNISHCEGLLVCAVTLEGKLGVDVEDIKQIESLTGIAQRHFSAKEFADLLKQSQEKQHKRFFEYWTLKEAYIKAKGKGLAIPLDNFSFELSQPGSIIFSADPTIECDPADWQFRLHRPTERHQMALAFRQIGATHFKIVEHWNLL